MFILKKIFVYKKALLEKIPVFYCKITFVDSQHTPTKTEDYLKKKRVYTRDCKIYDVQKNLSQK